MVLKPSFVGCVFFFFFPLSADLNIVIKKPLNMEPKDKKVFIASENEIIEELHKKISYGDTYEIILAGAVNWRREIEKKLHKNGWSTLGLRRKKYSFYFFTHIQDIPLPDTSKRARAVLDRGVIAPYYFETFDASFPFNLYQFFGEFQDTLIPLTKIIEYPGFNYRKNGPLLEIYGKNCREPIVFEHTNEKELGKLDTILKALYQNCLTASNGELFSKLGLFYWWFVHAKPFIRGSNSIGRVLVLSVLKSKGESLSFKEGVFPHFEALFEPNGEGYGSIFRDFFDEEIKNG
ncbi:hypothetical protein EB008_01655 [bacterium]|nr:hypothetical protein [bacterium]